MFLKPILSFTEMKYTMVEETELQVYLEMGQSDSVLAEKGRKKL